MFWWRFYWGEGRWTQECVVYTTRTHFNEKRDGRGCSNITDAHVRNSGEGGKGISGSDQQTSRRGQKATGDMLNSLALCCSYSVFISHITTPNPSVSLSLCHNKYPVEDAIKEAQRGHLGQWVYFLLSAAAIQCIHPPCIHNRTSSPHLHLVGCNTPPPWAIRKPPSPPANVQSREIQPSQTHFHAFGRHWYSILRVSDRPGRNPESATVPKPAAEGWTTGTPSGRAQRGALVSSTGSSVKTWAGFRWSSEMPPCPP